MLTLPSDWEAAELAGLDVFERHAYNTALDALWAATGDELVLGEQHWIGGHITDAQGQAGEPDTVLLFHLADDESLGFEFLDGGTLQFRIPAGPLARGDYNAARAEPSSS